MGSLDPLLDDFWTYSVTGLTQGAIYALVALGYTLVYGVLRLINFAHSEVFMVGTFAAVLALRSAGLGADEAVPAAPALVGYLLLAVLAAGAASGVTAVVVERVAYRPLRQGDASVLILVLGAVGLLTIGDARPGGWPASVLAAAVLAAVLPMALRWERRTRSQRGGAPTLVFLISAIGMSFVLSETFGLWLGRDNVRVGNLIAPQPVVEVGGLRIDDRQLLIVASAVTMMVALDRFLQRTRLGRGLRAVAQNPDVAALMGVNADRVITLTFLLGGLMAGVAAVLYDLQFGITRYDAGFLLGIKAFTAAVLGGIGNPRGALLGGLLLGLAENWGSAMVGTQWRDVVAFVFLVLVLMFRPTGILGESVGRARA